MQKIDNKEVVPQARRALWPLVLVAIQFACLGYLAFSGPLAARSGGWLAAQGGALALGLWAVFVVRPWNVNVAPAVRPGAALVTSGPYRWIRHPMYTSLLVITAAWLAAESSPLRLAAWLVFLANTIVKLLIEERYLSRHFARFAEYRRTTWRLIPFVF